MPEDSTKLSTILHWLSIVISPDTAVALSQDVPSGGLTFSNSFRDAAMSNATRLLDIMRKSIMIASEGGNYSDQKGEYLAFVTDVCWPRLQDKIRKVPRFPVVPDGADVSTISSILKTIFGLLDTWNAWRVRSGLPHEESLTITALRQELHHSRSIDTLKHCFERFFHPLSDTGDRLQQLRHLWQGCYALIKPGFFADVFHERLGIYSEQTRFLYRVYRRIWRLYSYRKGIDVLLSAGIPFLISIAQGCRPHPPDMTFSWIPRDPPSTIQMDATPDQFIFQAGQRHGWKGDLAQDSPITSQARLLWSVNETKTVNVHPTVSLSNFLYSSGIRVMEDCIGTSRRPSALCNHYTHCVACLGDFWDPRIVYSHKFRAILHRRDMVK